MNESNSESQINIPKSLNLASILSFQYVSEVTNNNLFFV